MVESKNYSLRPLMIGGTGSDVGKSIIAAGFCRIFRQDGYHPAPFKAQNMALNSYVTSDGLEMGRAQAVQAEAAGVDCSADMNPILLKPIGDCVSQVVLNGRPIGNRSAQDYFCSKGRQELAAEAHSAFDRLAKAYNPIVMEGAGSIAEINLMHLDIVNMPMADYAKAAVVLVADISRGGVFACLYGSIMLLPEEFRHLIKGVIVNKFRGDVSLFADGRRMLQDICGVPVLGILPYFSDLHIEEEDSYFTKKTCSDKSGKIRVAVIRLSHISNFTDFDPLEADPRFEVYYTVDAGEISRSDIVILPGTKSTIADLSELYRKGIANAIIDAYASGKAVIGICGGYQMMGTLISDPNLVEGSVSSIEGLGLLPVTTVITSEKVTRRVNFKLEGSEISCTGYEIHMGESKKAAGAKPWAVLADGSFDGVRLSERCFGTYIHGLFENEYVVDSLCPTSRVSDSSFDYNGFKDRQYDRLANEMRKHLDMEMIYKILTDHD